MRFLLFLTQLEAQTASAAVFSTLNNKIGCTSWDVPRRISHGVFAGRWAILSPDQEVGELSDPSWFEAIPSGFEKKQDGNWREIIPSGLDDREKAQLAWHEDYARAKAEVIGVELATIEADQLIKSENADLRAKAPSKE